MRLKAGIAAGTAAAVVMLAAAAWLAHTPPVEQASVTDRYDPHFRKYNKRYFSVLFDWRWFKAQSMVESRLIKDAESDRGAVGIMQLLPDTFDEVLEDYSDWHDINEPRWNIAAGVAFNRHLYDRWGEWVPPDQRLKFTLASYNSGLKRVLRVRKRAAAGGSDPDTWTEIAEYAPGQTRHYVKRVHGWMGIDIE